MRCNSTIVREHTSGFRGLLPQSAGKIADKDGIARINELASAFREGVQKLKADKPALHYKSVTPMEGYRLHIEMSTGNSIILDLSPKLETVRFCPLKDPEIFGSVAIDGDFLVFGRKVKIGATEVMNMIMLPGI